MLIQSPKIKKRARNEVRGTRNEERGTRKEERGGRKFWVLGENRKEIRKGKKVCSGEVMMGKVGDLTSILDPCASFLS
ncbi:hypothetical protein LR021_02555 [Candidatus Bipolaricaulota bacterium]|nr:hypothetical protein [Candidatus Bipolaricaulota bacterium]